MRAKFTAVNRPSAKRYQFAIRSLLAVVVLIAIPCAWYATAVQEHRRQAGTVDGLNDLNVRVQWRSIGPNWLSNSEAFLRVDQVSVHADSKHDKLTDDTVKHLAELDQLTELGLYGANITDAATSHLKKLANLRDLDLSQTKITDSGLRDLLALRQLEVLAFNFMGSKFGGTITDRGIAEVVALPNLRVLSLVGTDAGEETIEAIRANPKLEFVDLRETQVSTAKIENLRKSRPDLTVLFD